MKKILLASAVLLLSSLGQITIAQNAQETQVKIKKVQQPAVVASYNLESSLVEKALEEKFAKAGLTKAKSQSGYKVFSAANWNEVSSDKLDVYYKVDGKKSNSNVTVLVSRGYDNFMTSQTDPQSIEAIKNFLNTFVNDAAAFKLAKEIAEQEKIVNSNESKLADLRKTDEKLKKEKEKIEQSIVDNQKEIEKAEGILNSEKTKLVELQNQK